MLVIKFIFFSINYIILFLTLLYQINFLDYLLLRILNNVHILYLY